MMNIESINQNIMTMRFSRDEFGVLRGCAADVTEPSLMENDYDIFASTGWTIEEADAFFDKIRKKYDSATHETIVYSFTKNEVNYLIQILKDTVEQIGVEFQTVIGYWPEEATLLRAELMAAVAE